MRTRGLIWLVWVLAFTACTKVSVVKTPEPPVARIICETDWSALEEDDPMVTDVPRQVSFAAARTVHADHMLVSGIYTNAIPDPDTLCLEPGEYQTLLYTSQPRNAYTYVNAEEFAQDNSISLRGIKAQVVPMKKDWTDAYYSGFRSLISFDGMPIVHQAAPLYTAQQRFELVDGNQVLVFTPRQLAQKLHFKLRIKADEKVRPSKVVANLTGVPFLAELLSGYVQTDTLAQTIFPMTKTGEDGNGAIYEGDVSVLGLYPPSDTAAVTGPGLLVIGIEAGLMKRKNRLIFNLKEYLEQMDPVLTEATEIENFYKKGKRTSATIEITKVIVLEATDFTGDGPIDDWDDPDDGDTKDISDGNDEEEEGDKTDE